MKLSLVRTVFEPYYTGGSIAVDGIRMCASLELPINDGKVGWAIPEGIFPINLRPSPKFMAVAHDLSLSDIDRAWWAKYAPVMPHIDDIPDRSLIMLHPGNMPADTEGCVIVGQQLQVAYVTNSRLAFAVLHANIVSGIKLGGCQIEVSHAQAA